MNQLNNEFNLYTHKRSSRWELINSKKISAFSAYYQKLLKNHYQFLIPKNAKVLELGLGRGDLLASLEPSIGVGIDFTQQSIVVTRNRHPNLTIYQMDAHAIVLPPTVFDYIILSDLVNDLWDVQQVISQISPYCDNRTRVIVNFHSKLWAPVLTVARKLGFANSLEEQNWLTKEDLANLFSISGFEVLRNYQEIIMPLNIPFVSRICNRYLSKIFPFNHLCLTNFMIARLRPAIEKQHNPTVSIVIAARNEEGHIKELISRIPNFGNHQDQTEIIFVEGHSTDQTYAAIKAEIAKHPNRNCKLFKQPGRGKGDAVRMGFAQASGDILIILDADITVPPEDIIRFYNLLKDGIADFANGVRMVYPMDDKAMRFFNLIGNKFFALMFSWILGQPVRDTLCGTKVLWRTDYERIANNRAYFGNFDPFGDFDLLFGAAKLNLKIIEVPIRYRARRYGETNISRWVHGALLLRMVIFAATRLKFLPQR